MVQPSFQGLRFRQVSRSSVKPHAEKYVFAFCFDFFDYIPYYNRGNARHAKGELEGALQDYNEAIRLGYKPFHKG